MTSSHPKALYLSLPKLVLWLLVAGAAAHLFV
jgi:hypothetical protein